MPILGKSIGTTFTEVMTFEEPHRIGFTHDKQRTDENSGVEGEYLLEEAGLGLPRVHRPRRDRRPPFPKATRRAVEGTMQGVMAGDGPPLRAQPAQAPGGVSMRILVLGATGYVGSRVVPALLDAGHEVVAASSSAPDPDRFAWGHEVDWVRCDVTDGAAVRRP